VHYRDGTEARIGDVVKGTGYNVKGADGKAREIAGVVIGLTPGTASCNLRLAYCELEFAPAGLLPNWVRPAEGVRLEYDPSIQASRVIHTKIEYGQTDHFELLWRPGQGTLLDRFET
jgi:hypothetical protein